MLATQATELDNAVAVYEAKVKDLRTALTVEFEALKAAYGSKAEVLENAFRNEYKETYMGYMDKQIALVREEGFSIEEMKELLGIEKEIEDGGKGTDEAEDLSPDADQSRAALDPKDAASSQETEIDAMKKSIAALDSKNAAPSPKTETDPQETDADDKEKSTARVDSKDAASSLQAKMPGKKERPTYEQKVMVLDSDQMAALEAKMANVMHRRH